MGVLDFLFEGQAPASVTTYGQTVQNLPQWLNDYTQGLIGRANAIAAEPYQAYTGPRVAGFSPTQTEAWDQFRNSMGQGQGVLSQGQGALTQAMQQNPTNAGAPFLGSASTMIQGATMGSGADAGNPYLQRAGNAAIAGSDNSTGGLTAAMPYLNNATATYPTAVSDYMSPYVNNVINRASDLATRTFNEKLMPQLNDQFTAAGQYGSSRHLEEANRGARDITEGLQSQAQAALDQAYRTGADIFGSDQARMAGVGQTVGNLADSGQNRSLQASQVLGQLGATAGNLTDQDLARLLQGGTQMGALGQTAGQLAGQTGQLGIDAAGQWNQIAQALQRMNIADTGGLEAIGKQQQALGQTNLDTAYQDFQNQTNYPRDTASWMSNIIRGLQTPSASTTTSVGPLQGAQYGASPVSQLGGLAAILQGLQPQQSTG